MVGKRKRRKGKKGRGKGARKPSVQWVGQIEKKKPPQHHGTTICQNAMDRIINIYRPMLLHCVTLIPFRLFRKNLGNLRELFG